MAMSTFATFSRIARRLWWLVRPLAIVSTWLITVAFFRTAYIIGTGRRQPKSFEISKFTAALAVAAIVSGVIVFLFAGKKRWAAEAALPALILVGITIGAAYALFGLVPGFGRYLLAMSVRDFVSFRRELLTSAVETFEAAVPNGMALGIAVGITAGILIVLARRWPRIVGGLMVGLLLACVVGSSHIGAFRRVARSVAEARLHGANRFEYAWQITGELASAIGATSGAVVGAVMACAAARMADRSRPTANDRALWPHAARRPEGS
jgi:hypothetical protein